MTHLDTSTDNLWKEIVNAEEARDQRLATFKRQIKTFTGPYFSDLTNSGSPESDYDPSNFAFQFTAWMLPQLVYHNPKWAVKANKTGPTEAIARAYKHGLDRWSRDEGLAEKLQMVAVDFLHNYGVVMMSVEDHPTVRQPNGGHKGDFARRPTIERIPPDRFIRDPQATCSEEVAFEGHVYLTTRKDLLRRAEDNHEEGWNTDTIRGLSENVDLKELFKNRTGDLWDIDRKQIAVYELWVKDDNDGDDHPGPDEGFNGRIYTLALDQRDGGDEEPRELRKSRPFYGPDGGPYHIADVYPVPNEPYRLSPLIAVEAQVRTWNRLTRSIDDSAGRYKRLVLVNSTHEELSDILAGADHDLVIPLTGLDKNDVVANLEVGGVTQTMLTTEQRAKENVERASGYTEAAQGQVSGNSTATEAQLVSQNSDTRTDFPLLRFHQFVSGIGKAASWYFWHDGEIQFSLGSEAQADAQQGMDIPEGAELWFEGGDHDPDSGRTFEDLEFGIEPMSMRRVSQAEQAQSAQATMAVAAQLGEMAAAMPWLDVKRIAEIVGTAMNVPELPELIDVNVAAQVGMQGAMQGSPHPAQPKLELTGPGGGNEGSKRPANPRANQMMQPKSQSAPMAQGVTA